VSKTIYYVWLPALGGFTLVNYVLPALQQQKPEWFANPWALRVSIILVVMCFLPLGVQASVFLYGIAWQQFGATVTGFAVVTLIGALVGGLLAGGGYYLFERGKTRIAESPKDTGGPPEKPPNQPKPSGPLQVHGGGTVTEPSKGLTVRGTGTVMRGTGKTKGTSSPKVSPGIIIEGPNPRLNNVRVENGTLEVKPSAKNPRLDGVTVDNKPPVAITQAPGSGTVSKDSQTDVHEVLRVGSWQEAGRCISAKMNCRFIRS
jgi:hypothetical protein